jgi:spore germination cell wall hydrolase CwlJ-like protein
MRAITMLLCLYSMSASIYAQTTLHKKTNVSYKDIKCVAETIYSEARGEPLTGQLAVGATIVTRSTKIFHQPACKIVKQQYTQKRIPAKDKEEFIKLATDILRGKARNPIGNLDSFDSFKHRYSKRPKKSIKIGKHYFYKIMKIEKV